MRCFLGPCNGYSAINKVLSVLGDYWKVSENSTVSIRFVPSALKDGGRECLGLDMSGLFF